MADNDYRRGLRYASESDLIARLEELTGKRVVLVDGVAPTQWYSHIDAVNQASCHHRYDRELCAHELAFGLTTKGTTYAHGKSGELIMTTGDFSLEKQILISDRDLYANSVEEALYKSQVAVESLGISFAEGIFEPIMNEEILKSIFFEKF